MPFVGPPRLPARIRASQKPYGCSDERAPAWGMGWQSAQALDELSGYINSKSYEPQIEFDSEASEELNWPSGLTTGWPPTGTREAR
jgi:hypothetical protein